jgi:hypothetical protein
MTACGGSFIGGEIMRNKQCPHEADLRQLSMRKGQSHAVPFLIKTHIFEW